MRGAKNTRSYESHELNPFGCSSEQSYLHCTRSGIDMLSQLSARGKDLFCYIITHIASRDEEILLRQSEVCRHHPHFAGDSFYIALSNLLEHGFLARKKGKRGVFYINKNYFQIQ